MISIKEAYFSGKFCLSCLSIQLRVVDPEYLDIRLPLLKLSLFLLPQTV